MGKAQIKVLLCPRLPLCLRIGPVWPPLELPVGPTTLALRQCPCSGQKDKEML